MCIVRLHNSRTRELKQYMCMETIHCIKMKWLKTVHQHECTERIHMKNVNQIDSTETVQAESQSPASVEYRLTSTGRPTLVGTRKCSECGRSEFHTKKYEKSGDENDLNQRYTLCKGVCVYCYAQKRNKSTGSSLTETQLTAKIKFYSDLLAAKTATV